MPQVITRLETVVLDVWHLCWIQTTACRRCLGGGWCDPIADWRILKVAVVKLWLAHFWKMIYEYI